MTVPARLSTQTPAIAIALTVDAGTTPTTMTNPLHTDPEDNARTELLARLDNGTWNRDLLVTNVSVLENIDRQTVEAALGTLLDEGEFYAAHGEVSR